MNQTEIIQEALKGSREDLKDPAMAEYIKGLRDKVMAIIEAESNPKTSAYHMMGTLTRYMIDEDGSEAIARRFRLFAHMLEILDLESLKLENV